MNRWLNLGALAARSCARDPASPVRNAPARLGLPRIVLCAWLGLGCVAAQAQVPPSPAEAASFGALHAAAHGGDSQRLAAALAGGASINGRDSRGRTALHVATFARQREIVRQLAQAGADLGALENDRYDSVTIAAVADDEQTLGLLLSLGASAKFITSRYDGTALIAAAHLGHDGVVRQLIRAGAPLDHVNNLHWAAVIEAIVLGDGGARHQACLRALVDAGANIELADRSGQTPTQLARARGYTEMLRILESAPKR